MKKCTRKSENIVSYIRPKLVNRDSAGSAKNRQYFLPVRMTKKTRNQTTAVRAVFSETWKGYCMMENY